jgi:hypothetical protein
MKGQNILARHGIFHDVVKYSLTTLEYFAMSHPWFVTIICLLLLDNNYNIFLNVEMGGNCILEKYLVKINFSKYIKYLTNIGYVLRYM